MEKRVEELGSRLEQLGRRWNSHLSRIADGMDELADRLAELIPAGVVDEHEHEGLVWDRRGPSSNIGSYGPCFFYASSSYGQRVEYLISLPKERKAAGGFYLHGDFHAWVEIGTPQHFRAAAKVAPGFLQSLLQRLEKGGNEAEEAAGVISATLEALRATK